MNTLDPKKAAAVAYHQARQIEGMIAELNAYDAYNAPEEDMIAGGKYAIGRLVALADHALADDVLPALREAAVALVKYGDLLEVAALAIGDNPDWWKEDAKGEIDPAHWEGVKASIDRAFETAADRFQAAQENPAGFGILVSEGRAGLGRMVESLLDPDDMLPISQEQAETLRGLGVYWHNFAGDPPLVFGPADEESPF